MKLEDIKPNTQISGIEPGQVVRIVSVEPAGNDAVTVYYKTSDGRLSERMLFRADETKLSPADVGRPWAFDAAGEDFKLATEAYRINLAYLFDPMMAVHTSNVEPLPHQITAVYESMLPKQPLRYVLADDPGAGKTIMAGLLIREMTIRADAKRILIVAPGSLVEQWQDELFEKFGMEFFIFTRDLEAQTRSGNPFDDKDLLIARVDQLARDEELQEKLKNTQWDLIVVDEAHKLSANYYGNKINKTKRFNLGELLGSITRHFLLMTATPHNGKDEDFQLFLSLLDSDRFYGKFRDGVHKVDVSDIMRRMVKEELLKFDGTPLFPKRMAYAVNYKLSDPEVALYTAVTDYVKEEMNKADRLDNKRKGTVGFALTALQRRLASSPEAIFQSLKRRHKKLKNRVEEEKLRQRGQTLAETLNFQKDVPEDLWEASDELSSDAYENLEEEFVDQATAAQTIQELESEILILQDLEEQAKQVVYSGQDRKWDELSKLLQGTPEMRDADDHQRKLIIFTEHRDTLNYLAEKIRGLLGSIDAVVLIHGGIKREERRKVQELFRNDKTTRVLIATDAAGEGVNLQNANLMVNYDLPWNPNRLEQRFGRIHRIGQTEVCHLWNLIANETREGQVFQRLFEKLEEARKALGGKVFNVLGDDVFSEVPLRDLLIRAIRYGEDPEVRNQLFVKVDGALDIAHIKAIMDRNALCEDVMTADRVFAIKNDMEKAEARKLQPFFIRSFFNKAFEHFNGELRAREPGRYEITHVPAVIRDRDRQLSGRDRRNLNPVLKKYERVCFEKQFVRLTDRVGAPMASLVHPGHPLMQSLVDLVLENYRPMLKRGCVLLNPHDLGTEPKVLFIIDHSVRESGEHGRSVSRITQFVEINECGEAIHAGFAPHLDLEPISSEDLVLVQDALHAPWISSNLEQMALTHASQHLVPEHFNEVKGRRERHVDKTLAAVNERLVKEINYWSDRYIKLKDDMDAGKDVRLNLDNVKRTIDDLTVRLDSRKKELESMRNVISTTPIVVGGALVIPAGLLAERKGKTEFSGDATARKAIEMIAMKAVTDHERSLGYEPRDVSKQNLGWDIESMTKDGTLRLIEVKGRHHDATTVTVTRNEIMACLNKPELFLLALVTVKDRLADTPKYIRHFIKQEPDWAVASINYDLKDLIKAIER